MLAILPIITNLLATVTTNAASANSSCDTKEFNIPWTLSNLTIYQPQKSFAEQHGSIQFHFCDQNDRLQLETTCSGTVSSDGACEGEGGGYVGCEDKQVGFKLRGGVVSVEREYKDHCLGPKPYDVGTAFGQNTTQLTVVNSDTSGKMSVQEEMLMNVTSLAA